MSLLKEIQPYLWRVEHANKDIEYVISEDDLPAVINKVLDAAIANIDELLVLNRKELVNYGIIISKESVQALKEGKDDD